MFTGFSRPEAFEAYLLPFSKRIAQRILESNYRFIGDSTYWRTFVKEVNDTYFSNPKVLEFYGHDTLINEAKRNFFESTFMPISRYVLAMLVSQKLTEKGLFTKEQALLYINATLSIWYQDNGQSPKLCQIKGNFRKSAGWLIDISDEYSSESTRIKQEYYQRKLRCLLELQNSFGRNISMISLIEHEIVIHRNGLMLWYLFERYKLGGEYRNNPSAVYKSASILEAVKDYLFGDSTASLDTIFQLEDSGTSIQQEIQTTDSIIHRVLNHQGECPFGHLLGHQFIQIAEIPTRIAIDLNDDSEVGNLIAFDGCMEGAVKHILTERNKPEEVVSEIRYSITENKE